MKGNNSTEKQKQNCGTKHHSEKCKQSRLTRQSTLTHASD